MGWARVRHNALFRGALSILRIKLRGREEGYDFLQRLHIRSEHQPAVIALQNGHDIDPALLVWVQIF